MIIDVARIPPEGARRRGEEELVLVNNGDDVLCGAGGPVSYDLQVQVVSARLLVQGSLRSRVTLPCSRCADAFALDVSEPAFCRDYEIPVGDESVNLTPDMREAILLRLPAYPVCRSACAGLCCHCGTNLNRQTCDCVAPADDRWQALEGLDGLA